MVVRANKVSDGIGGHISTFASSATLYDVAQNHFFKGKDHPDGGDQVFFQGHASPGMYARAYLEGRLTDANLVNFRQELRTDTFGLSSYPHPWLMPDFGNFPRFRWDLGPIGSIYQARFNRYLQNRDLKDTSKSRVWCFIGDGECDEPETLGAISLAAREKLDNLTFVINCNLQRLDGPVRGNGKSFRNSKPFSVAPGWNVIKVIWGSDWDPLLEMDNGDLVEAHGQNRRRPISEIYGFQRRIRARTFLWRHRTHQENRRNAHRRTNPHHPSRRPRFAQGLHGV
jgi:pyruvate dehydrogenase E1 component